MDIWIFSGLLTLCLFLIIAGLYKFRLLISLAGIFILLIAFTAQTEGLTIKTLSNETTNYIYGNQTNHYLVLNESQSITNLPYNLTTAYIPLAPASNLCYYLLNSTTIPSTITDAANGIIRVGN